MENNLTLLKEKYFDIIKNNSFNNNSINELIDISSDDYNIFNILYDIDFIKYVSFLSNSKYELFIRCAPKYLYGNIIKLGIITNSEMVNYFKSRYDGNIVDTHFGESRRASISNLETLHSNNIELFIEELNKSKISKFDLYNSKYFLKFFKKIDDNSVTLDIPNFSNVYIIEDDIILYRGEDTKHPIKDNYDIYDMYLEYIKKLQ